VSRDGAPGLLAATLGLLLAGIGLELSVALGLHLPRFQPRQVAAAAQPSPVPIGLPSETPTTPTPTSSPSPALTPARSPDATAACSSTGASRFVSDVGFSFTLPPGWQAEPGATTSRMPGVPVGSFCGLASTLRIMMDSLSSVSGTLDDLTSEQHHSWSGFLNCSAHDIQHGSIAGSDMRYFDAACPADQPATNESEVVITIHANKIYYLLLTCPIERFAGGRYDLGTILETWSWGS
jgi:hypothetical protein